MDTLARHRAETVEGVVRIAEFLITATYVGFITLFAFVLSRTARERTRANLDAALFFGVLALLSAVGLVTGPLRSTDVGVGNDLRRVVGLAVPILLLRLLLNV